MTLKEINELRARAEALKAQRLGTTTNNTNTTTTPAAQKLGTKVGKTSLWFKAFGPAFKLGYEQAMGSEETQSPIIVVTK